MGAALAESCVVYSHPFRMTASMMLNVAYGMDVQSADEPIVRMVEKAMATISQAGSPGSFVVDSLPIRESCSHHRI